MADQTEEGVDWGLRFLIAYVGVLAVASERLTPRAVALAWTPLTWLLAVYGWKIVRETWRNIESEESAKPVSRRG